ncbi:PepSY-associated TM helix domain-containing protein [Brucella sp. LJL56]
MTNTLLEGKAGIQVQQNAASSAPSGFHAFITRFHFYVGLFVGPFILIAAVTGTLYVLTPQLENYIYRDQLRTASLGTPQPLAEQVKAAEAFIGDGSKLFAVRPSTGPGWNTRVMFNQPGLGESESRAVFIDPVTLAVKGDLVAYGTSGTLPFRAAIDYLHRNLMLGDFGRYYSELAASWLWMAALGGVLLWWWKRDIRRKQKQTKNIHLKTRRFHGQVGIWSAVGLLFLSATGMTWSQLAGARIDQFRAAAGWVTPSVSTALNTVTDSEQGHGSHQGHGSMPMPSGAGDVKDYVRQIDGVYLAARQAGIDSSMVEIRLPRSSDQGWLVREYDRSWPTQVDTIALDPRDMRVISRADFESFPIIAKLIRWGIDLHMGVLFGVANQIVMGALGLSLIVMIIYGYRIWWQRRPPAGSMPRTLIASWKRLFVLQKIGIAIVSVTIGWTLPLVGISLIAFLVIDFVRWQFAGQRPAIG